MKSVHVGNRGIAFRAFSFRNYDLTTSKNTRGGGSLKGIRRLERIDRHDRIVICTGGPIIDGSAVMVGTAENRK